MQGNQLEKGDAGSNRFQSMSVAMRNMLRSKNTLRIHHKMLARIHHNITTNNHLITPKSLYEYVRNTTILSKGSSSQ